MSSFYQLCVSLKVNAPMQHILKLEADITVSAKHISMAEPGPSRAGAAVRKYKTTYNSKPGTLLIGQTTLNWVPDVAGAEKVPTQQLNRIISERNCFPESL